MSSSPPSSYFHDQSFFGSSHQQQPNQPPLDSTMKRLSQKINDMSRSQTNNNKMCEIVILQSKVHQIEQKIQDSLKLVDRTIKTHKEALIEMTQTLSEIESRNHLCKKVRSNEIRQLHSKIQNWLCNEKKARTLMEEKIIENYEERFQLISGEFAKQIENRKIFINSLDQKLTVALPQTKQEIVEELDMGYMQMEDLSQKLEGLSEEFKVDLKSNEEKHEEQVSKVMELLNETVCETKRQIAEERHERESKKDQILELFEGAYKKLIL